MNPLFSNLMLGYTAGQDLKKGDVIAMGPDGKMYRTMKQGRAMILDVKAGEKILVPIGSMK